MKIYLLYLNIIDEIDGICTDMLVGVFDSEDKCFQIMNRYGVIDQDRYEEFKPKWEIRETNMNDFVHEVKEGFKNNFYGLGKI